MAALVPTSATRLLDVGCHSGAFGAALLEERPHLELVGIEPAAEAAERARRLYARVIHGTFPDGLHPGTTGFDCVVFNDVLEHMIDPWAALRATKPVLNGPESRVLASIPNIRHADVIADIALRGRFDYTEDGTLDRTHLRFFTKRSIIAMFTEAGFEIELIKPINVGVLAGRPARYVKRFGRIGRELAALQFAVLARAADTRRDSGDG
jgi:2-polyprenyl-3-methyl-5-hydroxy-6-metoxy-1,4-benzoquinol methylase